MKTKLAESGSEECGKGSDIESQGARGIRKAVRKKLVECEKTAEETDAATSF